MLQTYPQYLRLTAAAVFVAGVTFAVPLMAAPMNDDDSDNAQSTNQTNDQANQTATTQTSHSARGRAEVETRIQSLHDKLNITSDQESDWQKVAQTMRDNEGNIHQLIQARHQDPENMTAIDDLQSYQKITQAHADGLQKLTDAFQTLYGGMTDAQKKNADVVFGRFEGHRDGAARTKKKHS